MRIIPAIDIMDGMCVRLEQGMFTQKTIYNEDPLVVAQLLEDHGLEYLHLVDLDGARAGKVVNWHVIENIATKTSLKIDFGGGLKTINDLETAFNSGASQITGGSIAVTDKGLFSSWLKAYGPSRIILSADAKNESIAINGWQQDSSIPVYDFVAEYAQTGISYVVVTDILKDGMLQGPAFGLYKAILKKTPAIDLIASGGVTCLDDLIKLKAIGCEGTIVGKAIYTGNIKLSEISQLC